MHHIVIYEYYLFITFVLGIAYMMHDQLETPFIHLTMYNTVPLHGSAVNWLVIRYT
jgi:branched-subunit amino acid permease